jgi:hypothetical protein
VEDKVVGHVDGAEHRKEISALAEEADGRVEELAGNVEGRELLGRLLPLELADVDVVLHILDHSKGGGGFGGVGGWVGNV